jgi:D-aminopeptidase
MTSTGKLCRRSITRPVWSCVAALICAAAVAPFVDAQQQQKARSRDLGIPFEGKPGTHNAITDVAGVEVGHTTLISGSGRLVRGQGPVRTGVTAVLPRGKKSFDPVFAAWFPLNGNGEMTGTTWIRESGFLEGPILITNTHSVGVVRDATIDWELKHGRKFIFTYPIVAETYDGVLNDTNGFHVKPEHVFSALDTATGGRVAEGNVGGGTGMLCNGFKGGIGTSSRVLTADVGGYTVGVLVQCNYGSRRGLRIAGVPVGQEFTDPAICVEGSEPPSQEFLRDMPRCGKSAAFSERPRPELGSIIIVVATDAPLLPHQLDRLVKRAALGLGREGSIASNSSGDIFVAFSTANAGAAAEKGTVALKMMPNEQLDPLFAATVQATEEAVTNAMLAAETITGADNVRAEAIPHERLREIMRKYNRLPAPSNAK